MRTYTELPESEKNRKTHPLRDALFALKIIHRAAPGYIGICGGCLALNGVLNAMSNVVLLRYAVNEAQKGLDREGFLRIGTVIAAFILVRVLLGIVISCFSPWSTDNVFVKKNKLKINAAIDRMLFQKAGQLDLEAYEDPDQFDTYFKARDESTEHINNVLSNFLSLCYNVTLLTTTLGVLLSIDPLFSLFLLIPAVIAVLHFRQNDLNYRAEMEKKPYQRSRNYTTRTFYLAQYAKEMRNGNTPRMMTERYREDVRRQDEVIRRYIPKLLPLSTAIVFLQDFVLPFGAMGYALYGALCPVPFIGAGDCLAVINSVTGACHGLLQLFDCATNTMKEALYIENIRDFLALEPKIRDGSQPVPPSGDLVFSHVYFTYKNAPHPTLRDLSFTVKAGEKVALVGLNGAGKTTIAKLMLRLYDPDEGSVTYGGTDIRCFRVAEWRAVFSVVFQDYRCFAFTAGENVLMRHLTEENRTLAADAMKKADIYRKIATFPDGMDTRLTKEFDRDGANLSGGETQKLAIARVYARESAFAILDEPTSALDPIAEYQMYESMMDACRDRSVVFISHRLSSAALSDRVVLLEYGTVIEEGTHRELMAQNGKYAEMFRMQAEKYRATEQEKQTMPPERHRRSASGGEESEVTVG